MVLEILSRTIRQDKEIKNIHVEKKVKQSFFWQMTLSSV